MDDVEGVELELGGGVIGSAVGPVFTGVLFSVIGAGLPQAAEKTRTRTAKKNRANLMRGDLTAGQRRCQRFAMQI